MTLKHLDTNNTPEYCQIQKSISKCENIEQKQYYNDISVNTKRFFSIGLDREPTYGDSINWLKAIKFLNNIETEIFSSGLFSTIQQNGIWRLQ